MGKNILDLVRPQYHKEFLEFMKTGEAPQEFLDYVDRDKDCQKAVEMAFCEDEEYFKKLYKRLKGIK